MKNTRQNVFIKFYYVLSKYQRILSSVSDIRRLCMYYLFVGNSTDPIPSDWLC